MTKTFQIDPTLQDIIKRSFILNLEEETWTCKLFASMLQLPMMKVCSKKEVNTLLIFLQPTCRSVQLTFQQLPEKFLACI